MMKTGWINRAAVLAIVTLCWGCDNLGGPDKSGTITLSSQFFGVESYYLFGYSFEDGEMYKFQYAGEPIPDIINEGYRVIEGSGQRSLPGFNSPQNSYGFALVGEFPSLDEARTYFSGYATVEEGLQFEVVSDTVELYQVWVLRTSVGNYAKLLVKDIDEFQAESGKAYNEVNLEFSYQPDGSTSFPD
jgi:hypothetical protein